jgi:hypothetical protein
MPPSAAITGVSDTHSMTQLATVIVRKKRIDELHLVEEQTSQHDQHTHKRAFVTPNHRVVCILRALLHSRRLMSHDLRRLIRYFVSQDANYLQPRARGISFPFSSETNFVADEIDNWS